MDVNLRGLFMKRILIFLLITLIALTSLSAKSYVGLSLSPYFEFGSGAWTGKSGDDNWAHNEESFAFAGELRLDVGLYKTWDKHSLGIEIGTGFGLPIIHKNKAEEANPYVDDIPLYTYALFPYLALSYVYAPTERFSFGVALGIESTVGWLNEKVKGVGRAEGNAYDLYKYFIDIPMMYSFTDDWALRFGVSASMTPIIIPEIYDRTIYDSNGNSVYSSSSVISMVYRIKPYLGAAYTF